MIIISFQLMALPRSGSEWRAVRGGSERESRGNLGSIYIVIISNPTGGHLKLMTFVTDRHRYTPPLYIYHHHLHCHHDHHESMIRSQAVLWRSLRRFGPTLVKLTRLTSSSGRDHDDGDCDNDGGGCG